MSFPAKMTIVKNGGIIESWIMEEFFFLYQI